MGFVPTQERFEALVAELFAKPDECVFGTESADQAHARFADAVLTLVDTYPDENLGIVSHGTVMTLHIARANQLDPFAFWQKLEMPSFAVLSLPDHKLLDVIV